MCMCDCVCVVVVASGHASEVGETGRDMLQELVEGRGQSSDREGEWARTKEKHRELGVVRYKRSGRRGEHEGIIHST